MEVVAADVPCADRLTIGVMALVAEKEARATSIRTEAALAAARARGTRLGNPNLLPVAGAAQARAIWSAMADAQAARAGPCVVAARQAGARSLQQLAYALTARGVRTPRGRDTWHPLQIRRVLERVQEPSLT